MKKNEKGKEVRRARDNSNRSYSSLTYLR